jgi:hypothetical protein
MGLLVLAYKIKYLNFASFIIARMFLIISDILPLIFMIFTAEITFAYTYKIISDMILVEGVSVNFLKAFDFI